MLGLSQSSVLVLETGFVGAALVSGLAFIYQRVNYPAPSIVPPYSFKNWVRNMVAGTLVSIPRAYSVLKNPLLKPPVKIKDITFLSLQMKELSNKMIYDAFQGMGKDLVVIGASLWGGRLVGRIIGGYWRQSPTTTLFVAMATGFATQDILTRIAMGMATSTGILWGMHLAVFAFRGSPFIRSLSIASMVAGAVIGVNLTGLLLHVSSKTQLVATTAALLGIRVYHSPCHHLEFTIL